MGVTDAVTFVPATAAAAAAAANKLVQGLPLTMEVGDGMSGDDASDPLSDPLLEAKIGCGRARCPLV